MAGQTRQAHSRLCSINDTSYLRDVRSSRRSQLTKEQMKQLIEARASELEKTALTAGTTKVRVFVCVNFLKPMQMIRGGRAKMCECSSVNAARNKSSTRSPLATCNTSIVWF